MMLLLVIVNNWHDEHFITSGICVASCAQIPQSSSYLVDSSFLSPSARCSSLVLGVAPALGFVTITTINFFSSILYSVKGCSSANIFPVNVRTSLLESEGEKEKVQTDRSRRVRDRKHNLWAFLHDHSCREAIFKRVWAARYLSYCHNANSHPAASTNEPGALPNNVPD